MVAVIVTDFRFARQWKTKAGQQASNLHLHLLDNDSTQYLNVRLERGLSCGLYFFKCLQTQKASIQETAKLANVIINSSVW